MVKKQDVDLQVRLGSVGLATPIVTCSGTSGYGLEYAGLTDFSGVGAFFTKSITLEERKGNPPPRVVETRAGLLNAIGLANVGLERFIEEKVPQLKQIPCPVFVNVAGRTIDEYREVAERLDEAEEISGLEVNISCPNVKEGGISFGTDARQVSQVVSAVRQVVKRCTLVVKLSPNVTDILEPARAAVEAGAQCLSLVNTFTSLAIDIEKQKPVLANVTGGLSGPAIKPIALYMVHRVYTELCRDAGIPIIGMGGVQFGTDAIEFLLAGATAVGVGTALFVEPNTPKILAEELRRYLAERDMTAPVAIIGKLQIPEKGQDES